MGNKNIRIGPEIRKLDHVLKRMITYHARMAGMDEVTLMHGWIIRYLHDNREREVFQRDIEMQFAIGRSTVTNIIQLMEKKGYISRESVEYDARLKKVVLTEMGEETYFKMESLGNKMDLKIIENISDEEMEVFLRVMNKIKENAGKENIDD